MLREVAEQAGAAIVAARSIPDGAVAEIETPSAKRERRRLVDRLGAVGREQPVYVLELGAPVHVGAVPAAARGRGPRILVAALPDVDDLPTRADRLRIEALMVAAMSA